MRIGGREIGAGHPCAIVAELSNAHNGDRDRLGRLIDAAQAAGADVVKFQCYRPDELVALRGDGPAPEPWGSQGYTMRTLYEKAHTPLEWFPKIAAHCERVGIPWFSSVFGAESLATLQRVNCPAFKVSHLDCGNVELARLVCAAGKPVIVSLAQVEPSGRYYGTDVTVQFIDCTRDYPTASAEVHLARTPDLWGLSSHCLDPLLAPIAVARGAHYLEMHMMLAEEPSELESNVSLRDWEFAAMVDSVRRAELLLG